MMWHLVFKTKWMGRRMVMRKIVVVGDKTTTNGVFPDKVFYP